jgi:glycosyltransferase involved in cell wall biosynthesis
MDIKPDLSIIIPVYNEEENIIHLISVLNSYFADFITKNIEIIFVDDGSTDNSLQQIITAQHINYKVKIIKLSKRFGSHSAIRAGIYHATGEIITLIAADLQDPISVIGKLYEKILEGNEIVIGQRRTVQDNFFTKLFSKGYSSLMRKFVIKSYPQKGVDILMFNSKVKSLVNQNIESNSSFVLQILLYGFRQGYIEYDKVERKYGKTKWSSVKKIKLLIDSFVAFSYAPIRFVSIMGIILSFGGFLWLAYILIRTLIWHDLSPGWPALVGILMIGFGITNISLGIIAEYLWRTLDATRKRPVFIINEIIDLTTNETN